MKRKSLLLSMCIILLLSGCGSSISQKDYDDKVRELKTIQKDYDTKVAELEAAQNEISELKEKLEAAQIKQAETDNEVPNITEPNTEGSESLENNEAPDHRTGDEIVGISDKDIHDISLTAIQTVRNDSTGNWRITTVADNFDITEYALSYYETNFRNDSQIHAIVNFSNNTTTSISCYAGFLYVDIFDYVSGEEHDANILFSGTPLKQYLIYMDNGDIEEIKQ